MEFNPLQVIQSIKQGQNPEQIIMSIVQERMGGTPMGQNILNLAKNKDSQQLEEIAKNICSQKGIDYNTAFNAFKNNLGLK